MGDEGEEGCVQVELGVRIRAGGGGGKMEEYGGTSQCLVGRVDEGDEGGDVEREQLWVAGECILVESSSRKEGGGRVMVCRDEWECEWVFQLSILISSRLRSCLLSLVDVIHQGLPVIRV